MAMRRGRRVHVVDDTGASTSYRKWVQQTMARQGERDPDECALAPCTPVCLPRGALASNGCSGPNDTAPRGPSASATLWVQVACGVDDRSSLRPRRQQCSMGDCRGARLERSELPLWVRLFSGSVYPMLGLFY